MKTNNLDAKVSKAIAMSEELKDVVTVCGVDFQTIDNGQTVIIDNVKFDRGCAHAWGIARILEVSGEL